MDIIITGLIFAIAGSALGLYINKENVDSKNREIVILKNKNKKAKRKNKKLNKKLNELYQELEEISNFNDEDDVDDDDDEDKQKFIKIHKDKQKIYIDRLLDKIAKIGYDNLSDDEKNFLKNYNK